MVQIQQEIQITETQVNDLITRIEKIIGDHELLVNKVIDEGIAIDNKIKHYI